MQFSLYQEIMKNDDIINELGEVNYSNIYMYVYLFTLATAYIIRAGDPWKSFISFKESLKSVKKRSWVYLN